MKIGKSIILSPLELKISEVAGKKRYENARNKGIKNRKMGDQSNSFTDINAFAGELAFGKMFNVYPDLQFNILSLYDFMFYNRTLDVKTTKYNDGKLIATLKCAGKKCYLYALMTGNLYESPTFTFRGFMKGGDFFKEENIDNLGHGEGYMVTQDKLCELEDLNIC